MGYTNKHDLKIDSSLYDFINKEVLPGTDLGPEDFWKRFSKTVEELAPINRRLLEKRETIQKKLDDWHKKNAGKDFDKVQYLNFLKSISYIVEPKKDFKITTANVDEEIASIAGPQLVVPVDNARYALNAANARWGSLYDALYGTDVIEGDKGKIFDKERANKVISYVRKFLDQVFPINGSNWENITKIEIDENELALLVNDEKKFLKNKNQFIGYNGEKNSPSSVLLKNNNLHIDIIIDPTNTIGKEDKAGISDFIVESAISTIIDNEDSVAAVDAADKIKCYRNWLGLMKGNLSSEIEKNGKKFIRKLNSDRNYTARNGSKFKLHGRAFVNEM